jgi:hypothetical protein
MEIISEDPCGLIFAVVVCLHRDIAEIEAPMLPRLHVEVVKRDSIM